MMNYWWVDSSRYKEEIKREFFKFGERKKQFFYDQEGIKNISCQVRESNVLKEWYKRNKLQWRYWQERRGRNGCGERVRVREEKWEKAYKNFYKEGEGYYETCEVRLGMR